MRYPLQTTLAAILALAAGQASASPDANGDGMVSFDELAAVIDISEAEFSALDGNGDGMLDAGEIAAAQEQGQLPADL